MQLGINIRNWGPTATPDFLQACALSADRSGLDGLWFNDHIGLPPVLENNEYGIPSDMGDIIDPLAFASYLAAVTTRIHFGTGVLVVPYRPAILTAKLIASIQVLSRGRFLLGIGPGYLEEEFRALGVPRSRRGRITDEILAFLHAAAADPVIESHGQQLVLNPVLQRPPIYVGGKAEVAIPRALALGDGWMPVAQLPDQLAPAIADMQTRAVDSGRGQLEVVAMKTLPLEDPTAACELACAYREIGVTHLVHTQGYDSPDHFAAVVALLDGDVRQALSG